MLSFSFLSQFFYFSKIKGALYLGIYSLEIFLLGYISIGRLRVDFTVRRLGGLAEWQKHTILQHKLLSGKIVRRQNK